MIKLLIKIFSFAFIVTSCMCSCRGKKQSVSGWSDAPEWKAVVADTTRYISGSLLIHKPGIGEGSGYASITRGGKALIKDKDGKVIDTIEPLTPIDSSGWIRRKGSGSTIPHFIPGSIIDSFPIENLAGLVIHSWDTAISHMKVPSWYVVNDSTEVLEVVVSGYNNQSFTTYATRDTLGNWKINDAAKALEAFYQAYWNLRTK